VILLDSNTLIHYLKGREPVVSRCQAAPRRELAIPSIVAYELEYGTRKYFSPRRASVLSNFFAELILAPFDHAAARQSADLRADLEARGVMIGLMDLLIAGIALSRGAVLVTNNTSQFSRIGRLELADWTFD
jgi:tRNA(fMet)-specific endonuclease VapC